LKGEGLTNIRAGRFQTAIVFALITTSVTFAQSRVAQAPAKEPAREQSTNQIVGATQQTLPKVEVFAVPQTTASPKEVQNEIDLENAVIPPAPLIVKRSANAIAIPVDGSAATAKSDTKYEEHPVVSSSASVGSVFGYRRDPFTRREKFHSGVDIKARWGDPVGASQAGIIQFAGWYHGYGNMIIVAHGGGVTTQYAHLSSFYVEVGTHVERGTIIGRAGSTGRATSAHLHYELRFDGNPLNPLQPLALDPSSDYFRQSRPTVDAGRGESTSIVAPLRDK
jgi:murein DD-endopeptidase MepM/ murein hydrolase activator NlpD